MSDPIGRISFPGVTADCNAISSSSPCGDFRTIFVSSTCITASQLGGTGAPVLMRTQCPRGTSIDVLWSPAVTAVMTFLIPAPSAE